MAFSMLTYSGRLQISCASYQSARMPRNPYLGLPELRQQIVGIQEWEFELLGGKVLARVTAQSA
jgi:hypothetical protein